MERAVPIFSQIMRHFYVRGGKVDLFKKDEDNKVIVMLDKPNTIQNRDQLQAAKLQSGTVVLYHGTKDNNLIPRFGKGSINNDYGQGFYTTPDKQLGREWAYAKYTPGEQGYLYAYEINLKELNCLDLTQYAMEHWISELCVHRQMDFSADINGILLDRVERFIDRYKLNTSEYDVIIGYRADDTLFSHVQQFMNGQLYKQSLEDILRAGDLGLQVFIKSESAFASLKFINREDVSQSYEKGFSNRDKNARDKAYRISKENRSVYKGIGVTVDKLLGD